MDVTERCPACGAQLAPDVDWCGQCYARISRNEGAVRVRAAEPPPPVAVEPAAPPPEAPVSASPATALEFVEGVGRHAAAASVSSTPVSTLAPLHVTDLVAATQTIDASGADDTALMAALSASAGPAPSFGPGARKWASALVVLLAVATDLLFFPYTKFMALYGVLAAALSAYVLQRMWRRGSGKRAVQ